MKLRPILAAILIGGLVLHQPADARPKKERYEKERYEVAPDAGRMPNSNSFMDRRSSGISPAQAAREAQHRYGGGKVLSVDPDGDGYRVKLVRDGNVRVVFIPNR